MEKIEIWLRVDDEDLRLPVLPSAIEVTSSNQNERVNINDLGEILLLGNKQLEEFSFSSFFPMQNYSFLEYSDPPEPEEFKELINKLKENKEVIQLTITGTKVRLRTAIESFSWREQDGTGDVYYTLDLTEYVELNTRTKVSKKYKKPKAKRPAKKVKKKKYTIKKGDNLWNIAKKHTGNAMNWKKIYKENRKVLGSNPDLIYPGQVINL